MRQDFFLEGLEGLEGLGGIEGIEGLGGIEEMPRGDVSPFLIPNYSINVSFDFNKVNS